MEIVLKIETDSEGRAVRVRILGGGVKREHRRHRKVSEVRLGESLEVEYIRSFVADRGIKEAARVLGVSRAAIYQWTYRGSVPEKYIGIINQIKTDDMLNKC